MPTSLALVIFGLCDCLSAPGQSYSTTNLGTPAGFTNTSNAYSLAHAINSSGAVAGEWAPDANSLRSFLYAGGTNADIGLPAGMQYDIAYALNSSNMVAGESEDIGGNVGAFVYSNGTMINLTLTEYHGFTYSIAHGLNNAGKVVGESYYNGTVSSEIHAVIFLGGLQGTDLGTLTNGTYSAAYGINSSNVIVGESTVSDGNTYAFTYSNNLMTSVGTLGGTYSAAFAINDAGQIVGEANTGSGATHAFLYKNSAMTDLGTLGGTASSAAAINSAGEVVGYALTAAGDSHAFLYTGTTMLDLNTLISYADCTNLTSADGINDAGQIAATGYTPAGELRAFLLTPALSLANPTLLPSRQFQLAIQGVPGQKFVLKGSTNLTAWVPLNTNTLVATTTNWVDAEAVTNAYRFYRAQALP